MRNDMGEEAAFPSPSSSLDCARIWFKHCRNFPSRTLIIPLIIPLFAWGLEVFFSSSVSSDSVGNWKPLHLRLEQLLLKRLFFCRHRIISSNKFQKWRWERAFVCICICIQTCTASLNGSLLIYCKTSGKILDMINSATDSRV